jgi:hypothetical protein
VLRLGQSETSDDAEKATRKHGRAQRTQSRINLTAPFVERRSVPRIAKQMTAVMASASSQNSRQDSILTRTPRPSITRWAVGPRFCDADRQVARGAPQHRMNGPDAPENAARCVRVRITWSRSPHRLIAPLRWRTAATIAGREPASCSCYRLSLGHRAGTVSPSGLHPSWTTSPDTTMWTCSSSPIRTRTSIISRVH